MTGWRDALPSDGLLAVVKRDCPTCLLVAPVLAELAAEGSRGSHAGRSRLSRGRRAPSRQRSRAFIPARHRDRADPDPVQRRQGGRARDRVEQGRVARTHRPLRPRRGACPRTSPDAGRSRSSSGCRRGWPCGSATSRSQARKIVVEDHDDPMEAAFDRGWTDGLPIVRRRRTCASPACWPARLGLPMRSSGKSHPTSSPCTVEKAAINAVMAGCRPEYFPTVLAAVEAALIPGVLDARPALYDAFRRAGHHRERPRRTAHRHELGPECVRPGQSRQCDHRSGLPAHHPQCGRRQAGRDRPRDAGQSGQIHLLLRGGRNRPGLDAAFSLSRHPAGRGPPSPSSTERG